MDVRKYASRLPLHGSHDVCGVEVISLFGARPTILCRFGINTCTCSVNPVLMPESKFFEVYV